MTLWTRLEKNWLDIIGGEFARTDMVRLEQFLQHEESAGRTIYPKHAEIFNALNSTPFENIKVVIIGQDPYHGMGQANGLCFSVRKGIDIPPSLKNIYQEIKREYGIQMPQHGDLTRWAEQGVLLLNATLTVRHGSPGSHQGKGWEEFTDAVVCAVNKERAHVVFLLWGAYAKKKGALIDRKKHRVLETSHPSPRSAYRGFSSCDHFKNANAELRKHGRKPIEWHKI